MAIKKLQSNFTTPEQSKSLLELGVPVCTADCVYFEDWTKVGRDFIPENKTYDEYTQERVVVAPCWSVGRLIEIYNMCTSENGIYIPKNHIVLDRVLIEFFGALTSNRMDFSKLEE